MKLRYMFMLILNYKNLNKVLRANSKLNQILNLNSNGILKYVLVLFTRKLGLLSPSSEILRCAVTIYVFILSTYGTCSFFMLSKISSLQIISTLLKWNCCVIIRTSSTCWAGHQKSRCFSECLFYNHK